MKIVITWLAVWLLVISSAGAFYVGYHLVGHPDGSSIKLPIEMLKHTPFKNFYIPGIMLFVSVGLFGLLVIVFTVMQQNHHAKYITAAGLVLTVWILAQMALSPSVYQIQYIMLFLGIAQMLCGLALDQKKQNGADEIV
jgi:hypothetical protein